jgi:hypothetical protein
MRFARHLRRVGVATALARLVAIAALAGLASACGSGSSGFDPEVSAAAISEQSAIRDAVTHGTCALVPDDFLLCGANAPASVPPSGAPGLGEPLSDTGAPVTTGIHCASKTGGCAFSITISPDGYGDGTEFLGAVRRADFVGSWRTASALFEPVEGDEPPLTAEFVTDLAPGDSVFLAFLSYPPRVAVPDVGPGGLDVDVLTDLIAARADVVVDVPLLPPGG